MVLLAGLLESRTSALSVTIWRQCQGSARHVPAFCLGGSAAGAGWSPRCRRSDQRRHPRTGGDGGRVVRHTILIRPRWGRAALAAASIAEISGCPRPRRSAPVRRDRPRRDHRRGPAHRRHRAADPEGRRHRTLTCRSSAPADHLGSQAATRLALMVCERPRPSGPTTPTRRRRRSIPEPARPACHNAARQEPRRLSRRTVATLVAIPIMVLTFFIVVAALKPDSLSGPVQSPCRARRGFGRMRETGCGPSGTLRRISRGRRSATAWSAIQASMATSWSAAAWNGPATSPHQQPSGGQSGAVVHDRHPRRVGTGIRGRRPTPLRRAVVADHRRQRTYLRSLRGHQQDVPRSPCLDFG